jgi:PIN domain nuclease of toxin-antitoxin system
MKLLLDSHTFLWWDSEPEKLSEHAMALFRDQSNVLLLSTGCVWEIQIKHQIGKLSLSLPFAEIIAAQQRTNRIEILPITIEHVLALQELPSYHKDPFDRILVQSQRRWLEM